MEKKIHLDTLFEAIRALNEEYETEEGNQELFILKGKEVSSFTDDLLRVVNTYVKNELMDDEELDAEFEDEEDEEFYVSDWFDDDLD